MIEHLALVAFGQPPTLFKLDLCLFLSSVHIVQLPPTIFYLAFLFGFSIFSLYKMRAFAYFVILAFSLSRMGVYALSVMGAGDKSSYLDNTRSHLNRQIHNADFDKSSAGSDHQREHNTKRQVVSQATNIVGSAVGTDKDGKVLNVNHNSTSIGHQALTPRQFDGSTSTSDLTPLQSAQDSISSDPSGTLPGISTEQLSSILDNINQNESGSVSGTYANVNASGDAGSSCNTTAIESVPANIDPPRAGCEGIKSPVIKRLVISTDSVKSNIPSNEPKDEMKGLFAEADDGTGEVTNTMGNMPPVTGAPTTLI